VCSRQGFGTIVRDRRSVSIGIFRSQSWDVRLPFDARVEGSSVGPLQTLPASRAGASLARMKKHVALITGASAGLGKELAKLCARDGHDVVLVARSEDRLRALAGELASTGVSTHVIAEDLADPGAPQRVFAAARDLGVDVLFNNAGFGSNGAFLDLDLDRELSMVQVNVSAVLALTHLFAKPMRERGFGRICNVASTAGFQPGPYMATYYATKAFVISFSEALSHELEGTGVTVTCHCPGATQTEFAQRAGNDKTALFQKNVVATAEDVAAHAYRATLRGETLAIHGLTNWIAMEALRVSPRALVRTIAARLNRA
jgi:short-subunit dehydrogenase